MSLGSYNPPPPIEETVTEPACAEKAEPTVENPKEAVGVSKLPLNLVPDSLVCFASLAFLEGALKYGQFNWRTAGVKASTYLSAMERHMRKFRSGDWADEETGVPHLASVIACCGILLDASVIGKVVDDRPPIVPLPQLMEKLAAQIPRLHEKYQYCNPHHHTIQDKFAQEKT